MTLDRTFHCLRFLVCDLLRSQEKLLLLNSPAVRIAHLCKNWDYNPQLNASELRFGLKFPIPKDVNSRMLAR